MILRVLVFLIALTVSGCAGSVAHNVNLSKDFQYSLPQDAWVGEPVSAFQQVTLSFGDEVIHFQAIVELKAPHAKILLLDMTGRRAMDIHWSQTGVEVQYADWLPENVNASEILSRMVLAFWPIDQIKMGLPANGNLVQRGNVRLIKHTGETILEITKSNEN